MQLLLSRLVRAGLKVRPYASLRTVKHGFELVGCSLLHTFKYMLVSVGCESDRAVSEALAYDFQLLVSDQKQRRMTVSQVV